MQAADPVKTIDIRSWPEGCIIELNGEYLGTTPIELVVNSTQGGNWTREYGVFRPITIRASARDSGRWEEKLWWPGDRIPSRILFRPPGGQPAPLAFN